MGILAVGARLEFLLKKGGQRLKKSLSWEILYQIDNTDNRSGAKFTFFHDLRFCLQRAHAVQDVYCSLGKKLMQYCNNCNYYPICAPFINTGLPKGNASKKQNAAGRFHPAALAATGREAWIRTT